MEKASGESVSKSLETGKTQTATLEAKVDKENSPARRIAPVGNKDNSSASGIVEGNPGGAPIETTRAATSNHTAPQQPVAGGLAPGPVDALKRDATFYNNIRELRQDDKLLVYSGVVTHLDFLFFFFPPILKKK